MVIEKNALSSKMTEYPAKTNEEYVEYHKSKHSLFYKNIGLSCILLVASLSYVLTQYPFSINGSEITFYDNPDVFFVSIILLIFNMIMICYLMKNIKDCLVPWFLSLMLSCILICKLLDFDISMMIISILILLFGTIIIYCWGLYNEKSGFTYIASHYSYNASQEHTAVILPHDSKRLFDGSDASASYLLEKLEGREAYQVYFCPTETDILHVLQNPKIKGVWVFGHGTKNGVVVNDKFSLYSELMIELTDAGPILRDMPKKKYVYQCHCNGGNGISLPDYLLDKRGYLDENIEAMPNNRDTGFGDPFGGDMIIDKLVRFSIGKWEPLARLRNLNYDGKNKKFIDMYINHLR